MLSDVKCHYWRVVICRDAKGVVGGSRPFLCIFMCLLAPIRSRILRWLYDSTEIRVHPWDVGWKVCELIYWGHAIKPIVPCQEFWMDMLRDNGSKFAEESWRHFKSVRKLQKWHPADKSFALLGLKRPKTWRLAQEIHHGKPRESSLQLHKQGPRECRHETKFELVWPTICYRSNNNNLNTSEGVTQRPTCSLNELVEPYLFSW